MKLYDYKDGKVDRYALDVFPKSNIEIKLVIVRRNETGIYSETYIFRGSRKELERLLRKLSNDDSVVNVQAFSITSNKKVYYDEEDTKGWYATDNAGGSNVRGW